MITTVMQEAEQLSSDIQALDSFEEKVSFLRTVRNNRYLFLVLRLVFDKNVEFSDFNITEDQLKLRINAENEGWLKYFLNNKKYGLLLKANTYVMNDTKHRYLKNALEQMHDTDARLLMKVVKKEWIDDSVTYCMLSEAFPGEFPPEEKKEEQAINITSEDVDKATKNLKKRITKKHGKDSKDSGKPANQSRKKKGFEAYGVKEAVEGVLEKTDGVDGTLNVKKKRGRPRKNV